MNCMKVWQYLHEIDLIMFTMLIIMQIPFCSPPTTPPVQPCILCYGVYLRAFTRNRKYSCARKDIQINFPFMERRTSALSSHRVRNDHSLSQSSIQTAHLKHNLIHEFINIPILLFHRVIGSPLRGNR